MPLFEVVLKVTHNCAIANISRKFPSVKMFNWCDREHEVYEIIAEELGVYSELLKEISRVTRVLGVSSDSHNVHVITAKCFCTEDNSVSKNIDQLRLLHVSPVVYEQGWEYYRLIAFRHEDLRKLMERLEKKGFVFDVVRKVPFNGFIASSLTLTADALFSNLTEKQMEALLAAYNNGYYRLPRKTDVQTIASKRRVPRTTFQEHLKKAENKLVASLVPYIQLYSQAPREKRERLRVKSSP